jgi:MFS family permease
MFNQIYILLPLSVPDNRAVTAIFTLTAVLGMILQIPVNQIATTLFSRSFRLGLGMAVMASSFPILLADLGIAGGIPLAPLITVTVLSVGMLVIFPTALSMVSELGQERHQGVCFGVFYLFAGIAGASGGSLSAWLWEANPAMLLSELAGVGFLFAFFLWKHIKNVENRQTKKEEQ